MDNTNKYVLLHQDRINDLLELTDLYIVAARSLIETPIALRQEELGMRERGIFMNKFGEVTLRMEKLSEIF